jgi:hypothetical protein
VVKFAKFILNIKDKEEPKKIYHQYKEAERLYKEEEKLGKVPVLYQTPPNAIHHSKAINTKKIAQLFQESKKQALELEIEKMEREINQSLTEEQKELVSKFIQARKKMKKDKSDKDVKKEAGKLEEQLEEKGLSDESIDKIIKYCERFIIAEQLLESNIEIPTNQ